MAMDPQKKKLVATVGFLAVIGGVLALFMFLSSTSAPPDLPVAQGPHHKLRFNLKNELIGVEADPVVDPAQATAASGFVVEKKAVEKRIHEGCVKCHAQLPPQHPPKTECIKCHRMPAKGAPNAPTTAAEAAPGGAAQLDGGGAAQGQPAAVDAGPAAAVDAGSTATSPGDAGR